MYQPHRNLREPQVQLGKLNPAQQELARAHMVQAMLADRFKEKLTLTLTAWLHCPVIDKTGLTGKYDFVLQWTATEGTETGPAANWPSLFTAIQQQLELKLEPGKGPVPFLVIDHVELASGN